MKIGTIRRTYIPPDLQATRATGTPEDGGNGGPSTTEALDIPFRNILTFIFSTGGITGLVAFFGLFLVDGPKTRAEVKKIDSETTMNDMNYKLDALHTALAPETPQARKLSLEMLIDAGVIDSTLLHYVNSSDTLPRWSPKNKPVGAAK